MQVRSVQRLVWGVVMGLMVPFGSLQALPFFNGSFETPTLPTDLPVINDYRILGIGATEFQDIAGWSVGQQGVAWTGRNWSSWAVSDGDYSLELNGGDNQPGIISQTFDTVTALLYTVTFDMSGHFNLGGEPARDLRVNVAGVTQDYSYAENAVMTYIPHTLQFWASGASTTLTFASLDFSGYGPVIDNVNVTLVPEPASVGLFVLALGALVLPRRARKEA